MSIELTSLVKVWYVQTPWHWCWRRSLEHWRASWVWVSDFPHTLTVCTCSSSRGQCLSAFQTFPHPPRRPHSPYRNICVTPQTHEWESEKMLNVQTHNEDIAVLAFCLYIQPFSCKIIASSLIGIIHYKEFLLCIMNYYLYILLWIYVLKT